MADKLQFKRGLFEKLDKVAKVPGTLYVTTDEQAIYYDVSAEKRVRLSQSVVQVESAHTAQPPFSTEALYYFIEENALMKWDGSDWSQINSTATIDALVGAKSDGADKDTAFGRIAKAQKAAEDAQSAADAAQGAADAAQGDATQALADAANANTNANSRVLTTTFESFKIETTAAIADAKKAGTDAATAASTAQSAAEAAQGAAEAADAKADLKAPIDHASEEVTYGLGNSEKYGHVKLSDSAAGTSSVSDGVAATPKAVKIAKDAADAAQKAAEGAQGAADTNASAISALDGRVTTAESTIKGHASDIKSLQDAIGTSGSIGSDVADLKERMTAVEGINTTQTSNISKNTSDIANLTSTVSSNKIDIEGKVSAINTAIGAKADASTKDTVYGYINAQKAASDTALSTAKGELQTAIDGKVSTSDYNTFKSSVESTYATKAALSAAESTLNSTITEKINAANAMTYKGTVATASELDEKIGVSVGDTYVVTKDMKVGSVDAYVGDLLIASGEETDNVITSGLVWQVVATGYNSTKDPKLVTADNTVTLQNAANGSLGSVTFAADTNSALKVSTSSNTITYSLEWGEF